MNLSVFKSIRSRIRFWFLLISLIPLLSALIITYHKRVKVIQTRTFEKLTAIRDLKVTRLQKLLKEQIAHMESFSSDLELKALEKLVKNPPENYKNYAEEISKIRNRLLKYVHYYSEYEELFILHPITGKIVISTNKQFEGNPHAKDPYFTVPLKTKELFISTIYYSKRLSKNTMLYSIPIFCKTNTGSEMMGIMVARINLKDSLYALLLDRAGLGKTGETLIIDKNVRALNQLRWYDNSHLNLIIRALPAVYGAHGKTGIIITPDYRDIMVLAAYTHIPETNWGFVCKQDMYELNKPIREMLKDFTILFILSTLLIYITSSIIGKTITKPIIDIDKAAKKIKNEDYSFVNTITTKDEVGSLAESIDEMSKSIKSRITIQQSVADIVETIIRYSSLKEFSLALLRQLMKISDSNIGAFYIKNHKTETFELFSSIGTTGNFTTSFNEKTYEGELGNAIAQKKIYYIKNIPEDTVFKFKSTVGDILPKEIVTIPLLVKNNVEALISLASIRPFSGDYTTILDLSWWSMNAIYTSILSSEETKRLANNISQSNKQLETQAVHLKKTSEELNIALKETENSRDKIDAILKSIGDGLIVTDINNHVILINHIAEHLFKVSLDTITNKPLDSVIEDKSLLNGITSSLKKGMECSFDFTLPSSPEQKPLIFNARTSIIHDKEGKKSGLITIFHDVSQQREIDRMKSEFISTAAHELRTPLTAIQGFSEILLTRKNLPLEQKKKFLAHINTQSVTLVSIINDLLDIYRIESGKSFKLDKELCSPKELINTVTAPFIMQNKNYDFSINIHDDFITLDKAKILQVFKNIISNAIKYSPDGGTIKIKGKMLPEEKKYQFSIEDAGIGMTQKEKEKIFDKFYRADSTDTTPIEGAGLGMCIVKHIIEAHKGTIQVESVYGEGTKVTFLLPT